MNSEILPGSIVLDFGSGSVHETISTNSEPIDKSSRHNSSKGNFYTGMSNGFAHLHISKRH